MRVRLHIYALLIILPLTAAAQNSYLPLHRDLMLCNFGKKDSLYGFHSSIKPYLHSDIIADSSISHSVFSNLITRPIKEGNSFSLTVLPIINGSYGAGSGHLFKISAGAGILLQSGNNLSFGLNYSFNYERFPGQYSALLDSGFIPHYGRFTSGLKDNSYTFQDFTAYLSWSPFKFLNIQLGKDRNFWGEGYRSLFLSDNANSYPFLKTTFSAWRIKYVSILAFLKDVDLPGNSRTLYPKFCALHYLSWNATSRLNFSFYESVTFKGRDSTDFTAFDFQYLNPVIFYQPLNFSVGSPGKMHLGLGISYIFYIQYKLYGQFLLGEFVLKEFFGGRGWWGNKYAIQLGMQSPKAFEIQGLHFLVEGNAVRPYTYAHSSTLSNYGYDFQPLAHPFGANFIEGLIEVKYIRNKNIFGFVFISEIAGLDSANINYGQNIYKNYTSRSSDYGVWLLQGMKSNYTAITVSYSRIILPEWNIILEAGMNGIFNKTRGHGVLENYFYVSLKTLLNNDESFKY